MGPDLLARSSVSRYVQASKLATWVIKIRKLQPEAQLGRIAGSIARLAGSFFGDRVFSGRLAFANFLSIVCRLRWRCIPSRIVSPCKRGDAQGRRIGAAFLRRGYPDQSLSVF